MTDLDDLLAEVEVRTDGSRHWTGKFKLTISDVDLAKELAAAVRALRDRPCPYIETGDEGTSHCTLAEAANTAWAARAERAEATLFGINESIKAEADICAKDGAMNTRYTGADVARTLRALLAVPDRPGVTDNPTSDDEMVRVDPTHLVPRGYLSDAERAALGAATGADDDG